MSIINLPLVPVLPVDGSVGDAVPLSATINYIVAQVNANAQPASSGPSVLEWQPLGQTPTFISGTSFSVPGNLTATLAFGRVLQTLNTSGTVYSVVTGSAFTSVTTVTVAPYLLGGTALDSGLSSVNYSFSNSTNPSAPGKSAAIVSYAHNTDSLATGVQKTINVSNGWTITQQFTGGNLGEWNNSSGLLVVTRPGFYIACTEHTLSNTGVTFSGVSFATITGSFPQTFQASANFTTVVAGNAFVQSTQSGVIYCNTGSTIGCNIVATFSAGTPVYITGYLTVIGPF